MSFAGRRVLIVEDEFLVSLLAVDVLEAAGCEIVGPAGRLAVALHLARSETLDAALLDIDIAGDLVWPVATELQRAGVPFFFLSAHAHRALIPAAFAAIPFLEKPLVESQLLRHLGALWADAGRAPAGRQ
jgi:two-component SAPR family response regulator